MQLVRCLHTGNLIHCRAATDYIQLETSEIMLNRRINIFCDCGLRYGEINTDYLDLKVHDDVRMFPVLL